MSKSIAFVLALLVCTVAAQAQPSIKFRSEPPAGAGNAAVKAFSDASVAASKQIASTVVSITVPMDKFSEKRLQYMAEYLRGLGHKFDMEKYRRYSIGSGVLISADGYILTNHHVVQDVVEDSILVALNDGSSYYANLIGQDPATDLALLRIYGEDLPSAHFRNSDNVSAGEWVFAVGNPLGLRSTITSGIISAIGRDMTDNSDQDLKISNFLQTDAAINPGNSGGGLFDISGSLIGINSMIYTQHGGFEGYSLAIPSNLARAVAEDLAEDGKVDRGMLGVSAIDVDETLARSLGLSRYFAAQIDGLDSGTAAHAAGMLEKDVVLAIDGMPIRNANDLQNHLALKRAGQQMQFTLWREGKEIKSTATLQAGYKDRLGRLRAPRIGSLGVVGRDVRQSDVGKFGITNADGFLIESVDKFSAAYKENLKPNSVLVSFNGIPVKSGDDLRSALDKTQPGDVVEVAVNDNGVVSKKRIRLHAKTKSK